MNKRQSRGFFERSIRFIILSGLLIGFLGGALTFGAWSLFSTIAGRDQEMVSPLARRP